MKRSIQLAWTAALLLVVLGALLAAACGDDADNDEPPPDSGAPADPLEPPALPTGIAGVDSVIEAVLAFDGDYERLLALVRYTEAGCTLAQGAGGPPKCWQVPEAAQVEGTPVEVFALSVCQAEWAPRGASLEPVLAMLVNPGAGTLPPEIRPYGVYRVPAVAEPSDWPAGAHAVVFAIETEAGLRGATVRIADGRIVSMEFGCGPQHPALLAAAFADSLLEPPLGGLELRGQAVLEHVERLPLQAVEETDPRWLATADLAAPVGGYLAVLIDAQTTLEHGDGRPATIEDLSAGLSVTIDGVPLPWSLWRAGRIRIDD